MLSDSDGALFYFGFSHIVNVLMCRSDKSRQQGVEAIQAVPLQRILVETDVHTSDDDLPGAMGAIAYISFALRLPLLDAATITSENGLRFLASALPKI